MAKEIKLVKSLIGRKKDQIATANSLGLKKVGDVSVQPENEATLGKIQKISHLVEVTEA
ncbi:50S ribosomal protein L30 [Ruminococcus sp.]|jgi:large subunit ribosomal protein L30|uniref:50S ribosomal protein L30 n=1 Tax=Ruminococcus sp. TaxID=41978 RepID=UPI0015AA35F5|nr:50S ribosomal protein L30 [Ruminococcus sp.]MEE0022275.1 50S ribosomal protein L30 [Ruminococcus sp.]